MKFNHGILREIMVNYKGATFVKNLDGTMTITYLFGNKIIVVVIDENHQEISRTEKRLDSSFSD